MTVFLAQYNNLDVLTNILNEWRMVSDVKFNISKTEILPIGSPSHQSTVYNYWNSAGLDLSGQEIPADIRIAKDREAICTLGTWVGNNMKQARVWTQTLDKVEESLNQWELGHPTMEGHQLIMQMVVGGMMQFLTKVQGMPQEIEKRLEQRVQKFLWGNKNKININKETIYAPITGGGQNLLDIPIRNKAITVTWIHTYLDLSLSHPLWAYAADAIIKHHTPASEENIELEIRSNIFLQSWKTSMNKLPADLKELVKTA